MQKLVSLRRRITRSVPLSLAAIVLGTALLTPAVSSAATFLTKQKANKLFLGNTSIATQTASVAPNTGTSITVLCPPGFQGVGGGADSPASYTGASPQVAMIILESREVQSGARSVGWYVEVANLSSGGTPPTLNITAYAVCSK